MRSEQEANRAVERYADMVRRLCLVHLKNEADTEDVFQTVFLKYVLYRGTFESEEHEKAWILRVTLNACRDVLRSLFRARRSSRACSSSCSASRAIRRRLCRWQRSGWRSIPPSSSA